MILDYRSLHFQNQIRKRCMHAWGNELSRSCEQSWANSCNFYKTLVAMGTIVGPDSSKLDQLNYTVKSSVSISRPSLHPKSLRDPERVFRRPTDFCLPSPLDPLHLHVARWCPAELEELEPRRRTLDVSKYKFRKSRSVYGFQRRKRWST